MPYYQNKNILFVHVPKTGGSSLEEYLRKDDIEVLHTDNKDKEKLPLMNDRLALQHQKYKVIYKHRELYNINFNDNLKIITIVRNPYTRVVSDLFFLGLIKKDTSPDLVYRIMITNYFIYRNHNIPQSDFLTDENGELIKNLVIFRKESLNDDLIKYGFTDFNIQKNTNRLNIPESSYMSYLNNDSIKFINNYYKKDFILFNYEIKDVN